MSSATLAAAKGHDFAFNALFLNTMETAMDAAQTVLIYSSSNGDTWLLCRDAASGRAFVRHRANASSGGHETDMEIEDFLGREPRHPEHQALLRLIEGGAFPSPNTGRPTRVRKNRKRSRA
jgi:hypothetical protein